MGCVVTEICLDVTELADLSPRGADQGEEVERVTALGATRADVGQGDDASWVVLADPKGNEVCIPAGRRNS